jgi:hypothetical protein
MQKHLHQLGWREVEVVDDDLGRSAAGTVARAGFERMVAEVCLSKVGAVAAREVSRFARNSRGWQQLVEVCRIVDTVLIDQETVYAQRRSNDRRLLGLNRPDTQSTPYSTSSRVRCVRPVFRFGYRTWTASGYAVPPADITHVLLRKVSTESATQTRSIECCGDLRIGAPLGHFVDARTASREVFSEPSPGAARLTMWLVTVPERQ